MGYGSNPINLLAPGFRRIVGISERGWMQNVSHLSGNFPQKLPSSRVHLSGVASTDTVNSRALVNALVYSCKADEDGIPPSTSQRVTLTRRPTIDYQGFWPAWKRSYLARKLESRQYCCPIAQVLFPVYMSCICLIYMHFECSQRLLQLNFDFTKCKTPIPGYLLGKKVIPLHN
jgi:hypothetical protein